MTETPLTRRRFVATSLALAGLAALGPVGCAPSWDRRRAARDLAGIADQAEAWSEVGREYLAAYPDEKGLGAITVALVADLGWKPWLPEAEAFPAATSEAAGEEGAGTPGEGAGTPGEVAVPRTLARQLHDRIVDELRTDVTVQVHDWLLSRTEARVAALVALIGPESLTATP